MYVRERRRAGRRYGFRPEKQRLLDAIWPVLISFCDAGKLTVGMCISRLAKELSQKDSHGKVIPETEVTVSRLSRLIDEQVRFGVWLYLKKIAGTGNPVRLPKYVYITALGFQMLGVDLEKLDAEQQKNSGKAKSVVVLSRRILREDERSPRVQHVSAGTVKKLSMH
ncbi:plasmid replication initiator RepA [Klebsiella pneumoniae]|uniref:plasmid replication initiator RepA n=1 Tax=Klebsiella pneumoniae TaxID=573 RepID=UPI002228747D|nr:plasmid replication initiator RepA [Klebsiella pneumoniae]